MYWHLDVMFKEDANTTIDKMAAQNLNIIRKWSVSILKPAGLISYKLSMKKKRFNIEYPLNNASLPVLWNSVGTPLGLSEWFADGVTVDGNEYTFCCSEKQWRRWLTGFRLNRNCTTLVGLHG